MVLYYMQLQGQVLWEHRADVNPDGGNGIALYAAADKGYVDVVQVLVKHRADANVEESKSDNALRAAARWGYESIVHLLIDKGAEVNIQGNEYSNTLYITA